MNRFWFTFIIPALVACGAGVALLELGIGFIAVGALSGLLVILFPALSPGQVAVSGFLAYFITIFATLQVMMRRKPR